MKLLAIISFLFISAQAQASGFRVQEVELNEADLKKIEFQEKVLNMIPQESMYDDDLNGVLSDIGNIINTGQQIWDIVKKNQPVVNHSMIRANAIPDGITSWMTLANWSDPVYKKYRVTYVNGFGITTADYSFILSFAHSGSYNGQGQFLSQAGFTVSNLDVVWGYTFDSKAQVIRTVNTGTTSDPVAAMELSIQWTVSTVLKHDENTETFYIKGDGLVQQF